MDINKIILTEIGDFDWIKNVNEEPKPPNAVIYFIPPIPVDNKFINTLKHMDGTYNINDRGTWRWLNRAKGHDMVYLRTGSDGGILGHQTNRNGLDYNTLETIKDRSNREDTHDFIDGYELFGPFLNT